MTTDISGQISSMYFVNGGRSKQTNHGSGSWKMGISAISS